MVNQARTILDRRFSISFKMNSFKRGQSSKRALKLGAERYLPDMEWIKHTVYKPDGYVRILHGHSGIIPTNDTVYTRKNIS